MIHNTVQAAKTLKMRRQQIAAKWMGPPTHNDPEYSNDPSSGEEKEKPIVKEEKEDPDDSPDLDNLKIPEQEPAEGKPFGHLEIHFPKDSNCLEESRCSTRRIYGSVTPRISEQ